MTKVLKFKVGIKGLENKIWREIEITDQFSVADLAYTILATFDSLAYHLFYISYDGKKYPNRINPDMLQFEEQFDSQHTKLADLELKENDSLYMTYDYGSPTDFEITYIGEREFNPDDYGHYPYIVGGAGHGMLDDLSYFELKEIVDDTDAKGSSEHYYTNGYRTDEFFDYRDYDIVEDNEALKGMVLLIKNGYEIIK